MKKVMIGILILIPVLILVIVAAVSNFLKVAAWIAVDDIAVVHKGTEEEAESITLEFKDNSVMSFYDFVDIKVMPDYANRYSIEWRISGEVECMDDAYQSEYDAYKQKLERYNKYLADVGADNEAIRKLEAQGEKAEKDLKEALDAVSGDAELTNSEKQAKKKQLEREFAAAKQEREDAIAALESHRDSLVEPELVGYTAPPAMLVDDNGNEVSSNTTGKFIISSYCRFTVVIQVEDISRTLSVIAEGYDVKGISIVNIGTDDNSLEVGESMRVDAKFDPMTSKVTKTVWSSSNDQVASVDANGVITAHAEGSAKITVKANVFSSIESENETFVTSSEYTVNVTKGVSKFGAHITTSKSPFTLQEVGIADTATAINGCGIDLYKNVTLTDNIATINVDGRTVTVTRCEADDIAIQNADIYDARSGYVFAVSDLSLKLKAVWADMLGDKVGEPDGVVWSSNSNIVNVVNGEVKATGSGIAVITAQKGNKQASITLNVQKKLVSMKLRTGEDYYKVGLALETVFAAERYKDASVNNEKEANSTLIQIIGAPKFEADKETEAQFKERLAVFYNAYKYEILEGGDYAYFSNSETEPNRLIFKPSALEGKGKTTVKIKVSAKYPRYESAIRFTTETVAIKVIYGVEVNSIAELRKASDDQKAYALSDGNLQARSLFWEHTNTANGRNDKYVVYNARHSLKTYAISVMSDVAFEINPDGTPLTITDDNDIKVYGDIYGNAHRLSAERNQVEGVQAMLWIAWSNVTVSNFNIRANRMEKDGTLSTSETSGLKGECLQVIYNGEDGGYYQNRLTGVRIEYSIIENARRAGQTYNADVTFDGVVVRNIDNTAFYIPARMHPYEENGRFVTYPMYSHINMNNCVYSNCIATIGSYSYERYTIMAESGYDWTPFTDCVTGDGRFVRKDLVANAEYFKQHFLSAGINTQIRQTGFLDVYNWQNASNAQLLDVGDASTNEIIGTVAGEIIKVNPTFERCKYVVSESEMYFHMGILSTGITFDQGIMNEPSYLDVSFEDSRFIRDPIRTLGMQSACTDVAASFGESVIKTMEIVFYAYSTNADITPFSVYEINAKFISRLHESA